MRPKTFLKLCITFALLSAPFAGAYADVAHRFTIPIDDGSAFEDQIVSFGHPLGLYTPRLVHKGEPSAFHSSMPSPYNAAGKSDSRCQQLFFPTAAW